jgi:hypothetical protein
MVQAGSGRQWPAGDTETERQRKRERGMCIGQRTGRYGQATWAADTGDQGEGMGRPGAGQGRPGQHDDKSSGRRWRQLVAGSSNATEQLAGRR